MSGDETAMFACGQEQGAFWLETRKPSVRLGFFQFRF